MTPPIVLPATTIVGRRKITRSYPKYDAELDQTVCDKYTNADLTLTMRLGFRQINPPGTAATGTYRDYNDNTTADGDPMGTQRQIRRWTPSSWAQWKTNFVRSAQRFWHGKFWLVNNFERTLEFDDGGTVYRHNVYCRFRLLGSDASAGTSHHHVIDVVRLAASETWFGSHSTLYDNLDTDPKPNPPSDSGGNPVIQRAHVHEVGHLLGLGHATQGSWACPQTGNTNATACYGSTDHDMHNVMGSGMALYPEHAYPWRKTIADITGKGTVRSPSENRTRVARAQLASILLGSPQDPGLSSDWAAQMTRHYPRTLEEARRGAAITRRPQR